MNSTTKDKGGLLFEAERAT